MPPMISIGSTGPVVSQLQQSLNLLPTELKRLIEDGIFGQMTQARVIEFQKLNDLSPDGIVGPLTWDLLLQLAAELSAGVYQNSLARLAVVAMAKAEASLGGVYAKLSGGRASQNQKWDFRHGYRRLLKYFRISAPQPGAINTSYYNEDDITYLKSPGSLSPMKSWCGIFALWAVKMAGLQVGTWVDQLGIGSVKGFKPVFKTHVAAGDIGFLPNNHQHHFIIEQVVRVGGVPTALTIEGNSGVSSGFTFQRRPIETIDNFYTCYDS